MISVGSGYTNECRGCGQSDTFKRSREYVEVQYLATEDQDGDIVVSIDSTEHDGPTTEWEYECTHCGLTGQDLDDLLADAPDPEDDD